MTTHRTTSPAQHDRAERHGLDPTHRSVDTTREAQLGALIDPQPNGCWLYTGKTDHQGKARIRHAGHTVLVHRYIFDILRGPFPPEHSLRRTCPTPRCVNPEHRKPTP